MVDDVYEFMFEVKVILWDVDKLVVMEVDIVVFKDEI